MKQPSTSDSDSEFEKRKPCKSPAKLPKQQKHRKKNPLANRKRLSMKSVTGSSDNDLEPRKKSKPTPVEWSTVNVSSIPVPATTQISLNQLQNAVTEAVAIAASDVTPNEPHPLILGSNDWPLPGARKTRPNSALPLPNAANRPGPRPRTPPPFVSSESSVYPSAGPSEPDDKPKKKRAVRFTKTAERQKTSITVVRCGLKSIFRTSDNTTIIINYINDMCLRATKISVLASLAMLDFINRSVDTNIQIFDTFLSGHIESIFQGVSTARNTDYNDVLSLQFRNLMQRYNVARPSTAIMNNSFKYLWQQYETNFFVNVKTHAEKRFTRLFRLWFVQENDEKPNKRQYNELKRAAKYIMNVKCKARRNDLLIDRFMGYLPNTLTDGLDSSRPGFLQRFVWKNSWFRMVPVFIKIQRAIDFYHQHCRSNNIPIRVGNFHVVPLHNSKMKNIRIDTTTFQLMLQHLKIAPKKPSEKKVHGFVNLTGKEFDENRDQYWFQYLNERVVKKLKRNSEFDYSLVTDGIAVSVQFQNEKPPKPVDFDELVKKQRELYGTFGERYNQNEYGTVIGLDPGYKLFIAGVVKNLETAEETEVKISSRKFYNMTMQNFRDKKVKSFTENFENLAANDRNTAYNGVIVSAMSTSYMLHIEHKLKFFDDGISVYTTREYTRLAFDKYISTQRAMDSIVNHLMRSKGNKRVLLVIGATEFSPHSPIKKYRRCPGTRKIINFVRKIVDCDVVFADEYNTSQVCGRCQRRFGTTEIEIVTHKRWTSQGHRHRQCNACVPNADVISLPDVINTKLGSKAIAISRLERIRSIFLKYNDCSYADATTAVDEQIYVNGDAFHAAMYTKTQYDESDYRHTSLKCVWNRDISAARNIIIKGVCLILNVPPPPTLRRTNANNDDEDNDDDNVI